MNRINMELQRFTGRATGDVIESKYLAHYIDSSFGGTTAYVRIGKDLEELDIQMNPDTEEKTNILGEASFVIKGYKPSFDVDTNYCYEDDPMFTQLYSIINNRSTGTALETTIVDVVIDTDDTCDTAWRENIKVVPQALQNKDGKMCIPYKVHYSGDRVSGTWALATKTFTPAA